MGPGRTINEVELESILDDFESGDRVYWQVPSLQPWFGIVTKVGDESVWIQITEFGKDQAPIEAKLSAREKGIFRLDNWRKLPDDTLIQVGDVLSRHLPYSTPASIKREYFTVMEIIPGQKISMRHNQRSYIRVNAEDRTSLDEVLVGWELEG